MFLLSFLCTIINNLSIMLHLFIHERSRWKFFWKIVWRRSMQEEKLNILITMSILCWMNTSNNKWLMLYEAVEFMSFLRNESRLKLWNSLIIQRLILWWIIWCWCVKKIIIICSWLICFLWTWRMRISFLVQCTFASWTMKKWIRLSELNMRQLYDTKIHYCASFCNLLFISSIIETLYKSRFHIFKNNNNDTIFICFKKVSWLHLCCMKFN